MEEPTEKPKITEEASVKTSREFKRLLFGLIAVIVFSIIATYGYYYLTNKNLFPKISVPSLTSKPNSSNLPIPADKIVAKVGLETLYQIDLDYYLSTFFSGQGYTPKDKALDKMIDDSIILQEGQKNGFINLTAQVFNTPNKNIASRSALIEKTKNKLVSEKVSAISGEALRIFFHNPAYPDPSIGVAKAEELAKDKINKIRQTIVSQNISFTQAAKLITNDNSIAKLDPSYRLNTYRIFQDYDKSTSVFLDPVLNTQVWDLPVNELSTVLVSSHDDSGKETHPVFFTIVKLTKKTTGSSSFEKLLNNLKKGYAIAKY